MTADKIRFLSWSRSGIYDLVGSETLTDGRLTGRVTLSLTDDGEPGHPPATGNAAFTLIGARDIATIDPRSVLRCAPAADSTGAETTKMVHVDFVDPSLPWQYSPTLAHGARLRPWIVLIVARRDEAVVDRARGVITVPASSLQGLDLQRRSHNWAHVQQEGGHQISRLVCPQVAPGSATDDDVLAADTDYVAAVVAAFDDSGGPAWASPTNQAAVRLRLMFSWSFSTGDAGDFETLAGAIRLGRAGGLGRAPLTYVRGGSEADADAVNLHLRGAITGLAADDTTAVLNAAQAAADLVRRRESLEAAVDPLGRKVTGFARYGSVWAADPDTTEWGAALNADPRLRATASLGIRMGRDAQDGLVEAVMTQLGSLPLAAHLVSTLAFGLHHGASSLARHLPSDRARQVDVLSPLLRRMRATHSSAP